MANEVVGEQAELEEKERARRPAMSLGQAQKFVLELPDGYSIYMRNTRSPNGRAPVGIQWGREGDPPPGFEKYYAVERLSDTELEVLKEIYKNRVLVTVARDLALAEVDAVVKELAEDYSEDLKAAKKEILDELRRGLDELRRGSSPSAPASTSSTKPGFLSLQGPGSEAPAAPAVPTEPPETSQISYTGIVRTIPVNPHMAMYYAYAVNQLDYKETLEQFVTDCVTELFKLLEPPIQIYIGPVE